MFHVAQTVFQAIETTMDLAVLLLLIITVVICVISSRTFHAINALKEIHKSNREVAEHLRVLRKGYEKQKREAELGAPGDGN